ncbi:alkaline shock response membrane anchor protein AmaP [Biomaibacter acetigenes]|uniref:Alkaline shock response membrane anchor protein AmaP n=1 Tax=Biomaibacter acetigenes TaxID=2316383 RepID=A0A3G2R5L4_9FIRM|nr:alkaline shock response membrane anchor protein AmaP [Biomaibacter acetigenes]AYO30702.1 alkaline shock response membrane anchor protein AmaP [Biomaibacter acetigenes]
MNIFDRIILTVYTMFLAVVSVIVILFSVRLISLEDFGTRLAMLYGRWEVGVVGFIFLLTSVRFLLSGLKAQRYSETVIKNGELGNISISLNAIENLILKITRDIENVKDVKVHIKKREDGISILLKLVVNYDVAIPEMTSALQKSIKNYIETTAGITVKDVNISVDNIFNPYKQRTVR